MCVCVAQDCDSIAKNSTEQSIIETSVVGIQWKGSRKKEEREEGKEEGEGT